MMSATNKTTVTQPANAAVTEVNMITINKKEA